MFPTTPNQTMSQYFYHDESIQKPYIHSTIPTSDAILLEILPWRDIFASMRSCFICNGNS